MKKAQTSNSPDLLQMFGKVTEKISDLQTNFLNAMAELEISEVKKRISLFDLWTAVGLVIIILTMIF